MSKSKKKLGRTGLYELANEGRPLHSEEFLISREALDEAHSALCGAREALGDVANISHAIEMLKTAQGNLGDEYAGH